jgi:hypothetical protein
LRRTNCLVIGSKRIMTSSIVSMVVMEGGVVIKHREDVCVGMAGLVRIVHSDRMN